MKGYDIIGDVHGCGAKLEALLLQLGYSIDPALAAYRNEQRQAIFVGDLIDRGPEQRKVLEIVKPMVECGAAQMVMGNHEFNAIAFATEDPGNPSEFLRSHNKKHEEQHAAFLGQLTTADERAHYIDWFLTLPLWLELGPLRIVHACWHQPSLDLIEGRLDGDRFPSIEVFAEAAAKTEDPDSLYKAVDVVLKGPEMNLADYGIGRFADPDGNPRSMARIRWWNEGATQAMDLAEVPQAFLAEECARMPTLPERLASERERGFGYADPIPVFYGHYWRVGAPTYRLDWTDHTACVDFSAVEGGSLFAYRWSGESAIKVQNYCHDGVSFAAQYP